MAKIEARRSFNLILFLKSLRISYPQTFYVSAFLRRKIQENTKRAPAYAGTRFDTLIQFGSIRDQAFFIASSIATATATVAPTIGLLPMPIRPIISTCAGTELEPANCASECILPIVSVIP